MVLLAKPEEPLEEHNSNCLEVFRQLLQAKKTFFSNVCKNYNVTLNKFLDNTFFTIYFHDFGKGTIKFQRMLNDETKSKGVPHPLASLPFLYKAVDGYELFPIEFCGEKLKLEILAVASHHTLLHPSIYANFVYKRPQYIEEELKIEFNKVSTFYENIFGKKLERNLEFPDLSKRPFSYLNRQKDCLVYLKGYEKPVRDLFILQKGILNYCDWIASGHYVDFKHFLNFDERHVEDKLKEKIQKNEIIWHDFQSEALRTRGNCFIRAPCGEGKTEASLLWASNNLAQGRKVAYLLPTRVTTNKMWQRMKHFFGSSAGISHAHAAYVLKKTYGTEEEEDVYDKVRRELLLHKTFITPLTVTTVDHLLYSMFNHGRWDVSLSNARNALVIFDEIHCYEFYTLGLIFKTVEMLKDYVNFCFMSATFPRFLEEELKRILGDGNYKEISVSESLDKTLFEKKTVEIHKETDYIDHAIDRIIKRYDCGQKVLVICNTIGKSKEIYGKIKEKGPKNVLLYNSEYIVMDRNNKEERLESASKPSSGCSFIAVTTQVIEVSLDLDFDVLFTEVAPVDAIVQRIGRVNRKGVKGICDVFVFNYDKDEIEKSGRWAYPYPQEVLDKSWCLLKEGVLAYKEYKELVDQLYTDDEIDNASIEEGRNRIKEILDKLDWIYRLNLSDKEIEAQTRKSDILYVDVIPARYLDRIEKGGDPISFLLKIAYWKVKDVIEPYKGWVKADIEYDSEYGVVERDEQSRKVVRDNNFII